MPRSNKKNILSSFGDNYSLLEHDGGYILYDKSRKGKRSNSQYLGKFYVSTDGNRLSFNDAYYDTVEELVKAMEEYNSTLPFDAEIYNPMFRKNYMIECALHDYLTSLGFESRWESGHTFYTLKDPYGSVVCTIYYEVKEDTTEGKITRLIDCTGNRWTESPFSDLDSAIGACNTVIAPYCLCIAAMGMKIATKMTGSRVSKVFNKRFDITTLTTYVDDEREKLINELEEELKKLKEIT